MELIIPEVARKDMERILIALKKQDVNVQREIISGMIIAKYKGSIRSIDSISYGRDVFDLCNRSCSNCEIDYGSPCCLSMYNSIFDIAYYIRIKNKKEDEEFIRTSVILDYVINSFVIDLWNVKNSVRIDI